ncbi:hypothetical protein [Prolixibacter bellariivorans]|uniref:hypothetical protein n=1 Tax=Prolixibacter bellariivorans TaxID=314319 RepID=UPI0006868D0F|nr:hypothetical protein [Prolixibacter bellariivorans]
MIAGNRELEFSCLRPELFRIETKVLGSMFSSVKYLNKGLLFFGFIHCNTRNNSKSPGLISIYQFIIPALKVTPFTAPSLELFRIEKSAPLI